ncbi:MAG: ribonuclease D [Halieaceae bacterium]
MATHDRSWEWISSSAGLREACAEVIARGVVAVDTEFRRRDTFYPQIALLQLATEDKCWLVDPLSIDDHHAIGSLLVDHRVTKILHSASEDLEVFERWLGVAPVHWVDTQKAAAMLNMGFGLSYRGLVSALLDIELSKDETNSDWLARPLSEAQCQYAAADVQFLALCWPIIEGMAERRNILDWLYAESAAQTTGGRGPLAKFKSAWKLSTDQLAVLLALLDWRELTARATDKPRSWIVPDRAINELARVMPENKHKLSNIDGLPASSIRRYGASLIDVIAEGRAVAKEAPPSPLPAPASAASRALAKRLAPALQDLAQALSMNVEILMPNRELELLAKEATGETIEIPPSWLGWRAEAVIRPMRDIAARIGASPC